MIPSEEFIRVIGAKLGIVIHQHQLDTLKKVVEEACVKFDCSPGEYLELIKGSDEDSDVLEHLVSGITIGETYFFRDSRQMDLLQNYFFPKMIERKRINGDFSIRVWSAGCSSGEEIYTIAILLRELLSDITSWHLTLLGTDINTHQLKKAIHGAYTDWSMRSIPSEIKSKFFTKKGKEYLLDPRVKDMVDFSYLNLKNGDYPSMLNNTNSQDLIICRNVTIYFDRNTIKNMLDKFSYCLIDGGALLLGASDPIDQINKILKVDPSYTMLFTKQPSYSDKVSYPKEMIKTKSIGIKKEVRKRIKEAPSPTLASQAEIEYLENHGQWGKLLSILKVLESKQSLNADLLYKKAISLANIGKLESAVDQFKKCLQLDKLNRQIYLSLAMTLIELGFLSDAEEQLRKMLFLNHNDVLGHFQLGLLLLKMKRKKDGMLCLQNALRISKVKNQDEKITGTSDLSYGRLVEILEKDIAVYSVEG